MSLKYTILNYTKLSHYEYGKFRKFWILLIIKINVIKLYNFEFDWMIEFLILLNYKILNYMKLVDFEFYKVK